MLLGEYKIEMCERSNTRSKFFVPKRHFYLLLMTIHNTARVLAAVLIDMWHAISGKQQANLCDKTSEWKSE